MILVDLTKFEKLTNEIAKLSSAIYEVFINIKITLSQMSDDIELQTYPQGVGVLETISSSMHSMESINDALNALRNILTSALDEYNEKEKQNVNALNHMTVYFDSAFVNFNTAITSTQMILLEHSDDIINQNEIQKLVDYAATEMQITNIAAVAQTIQNEYRINEIREMKVD